MPDKHEVLGSSPRVPTIPPPDTECCYSGLYKVGELQGCTLPARVGPRTYASEASRSGARSAKSRHTGSSPVGCSKCSYRLMDRLSGYGPDDEGSNPPGSARPKKVDCGFRRYFSG